MHLNYFALRHFSAALGQKLKGSTFINSFSFNKEEIIFSFLLEDNSEIFFTVNLVNKSAYFQVQHQYNRPKRNFLYQFEECNGGIVDEVVQVDFDRSFYIRMKTGYTLLFKMHGGFSNILLINDSNGIEQMFKKEFLNDSSITIKSLGKTFDLDVLLSDTIADYQGMKKLIPLLDNYSLAFMQEVNFLGMSTEQRSVLINEYFSSNPVRFYLTEADSSSYLQIFPKAGSVMLDDPLEAYSRLSRLVLPSYQFANLKSNIRAQIELEIQKKEKQIYSITRQLENAQGYIQYENMGHIIMAGMHAIPQQSTMVTLYDFYQDKDVIIKLDKNLNAQENAEKYYRKSKALKQELPKLERNLLETRQEFEKARNVDANFRGINNTKSLKAFALENNLLKFKEEETLFPFRRMVIDNFEVWIGKNASNNDLLTFSYAHKNDIWMHARDVSGSHVIVRNQSGKIIPKSTLEKVASIAAYYSKSKNQTFAVVQYTTRKFVMKSKGRNPGEVNLLNEQTLMVKPGLESTFS